MTAITYEGIEFESGTRGFYDNGAFRPTGARMGMAEYGEVSDDDKIRVFELPLDSQGYFRNGAYFGIGQKLYIAINVAENENEYRRIVRASSRSAAIEALRIPTKNLIRGK